MAMKFTGKYIETEFTDEGLTIKQLRSADKVFYPAEEAQEIARHVRFARTVVETANFEDDDSSL